MQRNLFIYFAAMQGYDNKVLAEVLGNISKAGVAKMRRRMHEKIENNKLIKKEFEKLSVAFCSMSNV